MHSSRGPIVIGVCLLALVLAFCASFHVVTGTSVGFKVVPRASFGVSEMFINIDEVTGMPYLAAKVRYPLGVRILQREGLIESDEDFRRRAWGQE